MEDETKNCSKCDQIKPFSEFNKSKKGRRYLKAICKICQAAEAIIYSKNNKEKIATYGKKYREKNQERISIQRAQHTLENKERLQKYAKEWREANPGKMNAKTARRRAQKRKATPKWLTEDHWNQIELFYIEAAKLTRETGTPYEVDHKTPLQGKDIRGLHVPWNLKIITRSENRKKSRKILF